MRKKTQIVGNKKEKGRVRGTGYAVGTVSRPVVFWEIPKKIGKTRRNNKGKHNIPNIPGVNEALEIETALGPATFLDRKVRGN